MSFLLSSFFAVLVSSTMGLPLRWVSSPSTSSVEASLSWAPAVLGLFLTEVVSVRLNPSHSTIGVTRLYVPQLFVSSQQRFGHESSQRVTALGSWTNRVIALRQISVTALFYLEDSRRERERKRESESE